MKLKEGDKIVDMSMPVKFDAGKPMMSLVPQNALLEVAKVMTYGAKKYSPDNYLKGEMLVPERLVDAALRHVNSYLTGTSEDHETGLHALVHATASLMMATEIIFRRTAGDIEIVLKEPKNVI